MKLLYANQVEVKSLNFIEFDLFIASSGFERRAPFFFKSNSKKLSSKKKYVFAFKDRGIFNFSENLQAFEQLGFEIQDSFENRSDSIIDTIREFVDSITNQNEINILIDYSCMTKVWYADTLKFFESNDFPELSTINLYFSYTEALFELPSSVNPNYSASLMKGFHTLESPHDRVAIIIGLGYEEYRALGLIEYLHIDFKNCYIFKTDRESNPEFYDIVVANNSELLDRVPKDHIFNYPLNDLAYTDSILSTLVLDLAQTSRVLIAPIGPKPFSLLSLLLFTKHKILNVYRITQIESENPAFRHANENKNPIICKAVFGYDKT